MNPTSNTIVPKDKTQTTATLPISEKFKTIVAEAEKLHDGKDFDAVEFDNTVVFVHKKTDMMSDPSNWSVEYKKKFIMMIHDMDELPLGWEKLFVRGDPHRTRDWCYVVKAKEEYSDNHWNSADTEIFCKECCLQ